MCQHHKKSKDFILSEGLENSKRYFYPKDYTHTNDYGAFLMAGFVAECCREINIPVLTDFIIERSNSFLPPAIITLPEPPAGFDTSKILE